jgi:glucose-6-phosphate isomerase
MELFVFEVFYGPYKVWRKASAVDIEMIFIWVNPPSYNSLSIFFLSNIDKSQIFPFYFSDIFRKIGLELFLFIITTQKP